MSFKEVLDNLYLYYGNILYVFEFEKLLDSVSMDMNFEWINQLNIDLKCSDWLYEIDNSLNLAECCVRT